MSGLSLSKSYPHPIINTYDQSREDVTIREELPLHKPLVFLRAEKGEPLIPTWVSTYSEAVARFGLGTFDQFSKYFDNNTLMLTKAIFPSQGAYIVSLKDKAAKAASCVVEAHVQTGVQITQYKKDAEGNRIVDENGDPIPLTDSGTNAVIKEAGIKITFKRRELAEGERIDRIDNKTVQSGGNTIAVYPIFACNTTPGVFGNGTGFRFYYDYAGELSELTDTLKTLFFNFTPVEKIYGNDTSTVIRDFYNNTYVSGCLKTNVIDKGTSRNVSLEDVIRSNFTKGSIPFNLSIYSENVLAIGELVRAVEVNNFELSNGWMVDIFSGRTIEGKPYDHLEIDTVSSDAIMLDENYIIYLMGGTDGSLSQVDFEANIREYVSGALYPEISDFLRYPFTHIYDMGFTLETKQALTRFLGKNDSFKLVLSTQDVSRDPNSKAEDQSTGSALRASALLQPESIIGDTECCRVDIFQQCGRLIDPETYKGMVPATMWSAMKRSQYANTVYMKGSPKGMPASKVDIFSELNWTPSNEDHKSRSWNTGLNYISYADHNKLHYPDIRSVYRYDTSVLSNSAYTDALVYIKHEVRRIWATFSGVDEYSAEELYSIIKNDADKRISEILNNLFRFETVVWQTEEEKKLGYVLHLTLNLFGNMPHRILNTDIVCKRNTVTGA